MKRNPSVRPTKICAAILFLSIFFQNCGSEFSTIQWNSSSSSVFSSELQSVGITCRDPSVFSPTDSRRLSRLEIISSLKQLLGSSFYSSIESTVMILNDDSIKKDPRSFNATFDSNQLEAIDRISRQTGALVLNSDDNLKNIAGDCSLISPTANTCVSQFISNFGKRVFRRPLTAEDANFFNSIYSSSGSGRVGIAAVVSALLISPEFLYHLEVGQPGGSDKQFVLTDYELAARISFLLTDGPADPELIKKADDGSLRDPQILSAQVDRLLTSLAGREKVHRFFSYWLLLDNFQGLPTATTYLDGLDPTGLTAEMSRELNAFIDYIVYDKRGSYQDLLTSRKSFAQTPALASIYGHTAVSGKDMADTDQAHMGILLRSPVIANGSNQTHPILRGVFMLRRILCSEIPSPSASDLVERISAGFIPDPLHDNTATETIKQTSSVSCMACHSQINPLGTALEGFDNLGRARTKDKMFDSMGSFIAEHPIQINSTVNVGRAPATVTSAPEMMTAVAGGITGPSCFTRQIYRFYNMQREKESDGCALSTGYIALQNPNGSIYEAIKESVINAYTNKKRIQ